MVLKAYLMSSIGLTNGDNNKRAEMLFFMLTNSNICVIMALE